MKLNQVIALEKEIKSRTYSAVTEQDKLSSKPDLFEGFSKEYQPLEEKAETFPPESKRVQMKVRDQLSTVRLTLRELFNITATKDFANCVAKADIILDGAKQPLMSNVPVPYLLFLEKQLTDLRTLVGRLPTLDPAHDWKPDTNAMLMRTEAIKTHRTKKVQRGLVLHAPTKEHPAQTQLIVEDVLAGHWTQTRLSGATSEANRRIILLHIENVLRAVVKAREQANMVDAPSISADPILEYIFEEPSTI